MQVERGAMITYIIRHINELTKQQKIDVCRVLNEEYGLIEVHEGCAISLDNVRNDILREVYHHILYFKNLAIR